MLDTEEMAAILKAVMRHEPKESCPEAQIPEGSRPWDSLAVGIDNMGGAIDIPSDFPDMSGVKYNYLHPNNKEPIPESTESPTEPEEKK